MESASGVVGRNMATITSSSRPRDFPLNGMDSERSSHATLGWGNSIWNNTPLGSGFGSGVRDSSRPRENGAYISPSADSIEGKTGSGSLVASSESEWNPSRPSWGENNTTSMSHARSSGVSPARKRSIAQAQPSQQFADSPSSYYPGARAAAVGQAPVAKPKTLLDPTTMNFTSARQVDTLTNGFAGFGFGQADTNQSRAEASVGSWPDAASVHSPTDDRRSTAASEYFGPSSGTPSRSGSLPPSRHGTEPLQYNQQGMDAYARYAAQAGQRQTASFSHGRPIQERSGSIQSDSLQMIGRLSLEHDQDSSMAPHKPSVSGLAPAFTPSGHDLNLARENYAEAQAQVQAQTAQSLARTEGSNVVNAGTFTPDNFANGNGSDPNVQFRSFHFDSRSAPNGTGVRQSPSTYSHAHTPPVFDHLNPYRSEQAISHPNNFALIQSKLQGYQLQQERRNFMPSQFHQQQFQHVLAANQLRTPLAYQYSVPNGIAMNGLPPNLAMAPIPSMMPMMEPPKAPRDHRTQGEGAMSMKLHEFKQSSKTNRRWDLKDIYGHIVEFSGDQHGSRFIQQKLETANSDEKDHVFRELQENSLQLMQDVFGNYVIQKFFEHGDQTQKKILAGRMKGHVLSLSNQMYGCRVVQKALEHVLTDQQAAIVKELEKDVLRTVKDQNGNHVIQKAIERVPMEHIQFIVQAFKGQVGALSVNSYGCRVVQRLLEKVPEPQRRFILAELHAEGPKLISDQYGNYVTQHVIEHGLPEDRAKIISLVRAQLLVFSRHKFASNVVERCLLHGSDDQRREIMLTVIAKNERGENSLLTLIKDGYGNYVIQKIMDTLCRRDYEEFVAVLKPELEKAKKLISGKQIISVEKKMHRFDRVDSASSLTPQRNSISSTTDVPPTPPLTNEAQSPQSSSLPSANISTIEDPVHTTPTANKDLPAQLGAVSITNETVS